MDQSRIDIFPWNDSFNTGVNEIDQQHKVLVDLLNQVACFITLQRTNIDVESLLNKLLDYAAYHFDYEENYWINSLPDCLHTIEHTKSHKLFAEHVNELRESAKTSSEEQRLEELLSFLASWLASHILESDKHMVLLVEAIQAGHSIVQATVLAEEQMHAAAKNTINVILSAYQSLASNTIRLMREIKNGNQTLRKLSESEASLEEAMNYAKIGRWSFPYQGKVAQWSPQMFDLFGLKADVIPGPESLCCIMKERFQHTFMSSMQHSFETGEEHHVEYQIVRPNDGKERWIECRGKIAYNDDGTPQKIVGFVQDITERKENEEKITRLAYFDTLTSLPNRRLFFDRLEHAIALSDRASDYHAILFIDIDNFKYVNDTHGHECGDVLLQQAANRISSCIRKGDTLARIGGDEFVLNLSNLSCSELEAAKEAKCVARKILDTLALPYQVKEHQFNSSASAGVVLYNDASLPSSELMKQADIAMYQAKQAGKNRSLFYKPEMQEVISKRIKLEKELHKAVDERQFELYYQLQVDHLDKPIGAEALIRWQHPKDGLISPNDFIPLAEESDLIISIGDWVLDQACLQLSKWKQSTHTKHLTISVNVSYMQFRQPDFVAKVTQCINKYDVNFGRLKIELTESMLVDDVDLVVSNMRALRDVGIDFSLDDFGTGYSSLQYLQKLPISQLKIDRSFVSELEINNNDQSIVKTIILMAKALDIEVIAEGVEKHEQKDFLNVTGCLSYQGFFYGKPVPIDEFEFGVKKSGYK
jgi:diguanylate cyclase (GGDEF)-like protein/hemerythrin-like metal-binding protein/PAS domain S-box-containing protein